MHLLLQVKVGEGGTVDAALDCDDPVTVGEVADLLVSRLGVAAGPAPTLVVADRSHRSLARAETMGEAGIHSGDLVAVAAEDPQAAQRRASGSLAGAAAVLVVHPTSSGFGERRFPLRLGTNVVGRDPSSSVVLNDPGTSRRHASVEVRDVIEVTDLGSSKGVWVGGQAAVRPTRIEPGTPFSIGDTVVHVERSTQAVDTSATIDHVPFNPQPRVDAPFAPEAHVVPAPPEREHRQPFPFSGLLLPLLLVLVLVVAGEDLNILMLAFLVLSPLLIVGTYIESIVASRRDYRQAVLEHQEDVDEILDRVRRHQGTEVTRRRGEAPTTSECDVIARTRSGRLWERRPDRSDLLALSVGHGSLPSRCTLTVEPGGARRPARRLRDLPRQYATVGPVPAVVSLPEVGCLGVAGGAGAGDLTRALLIQAVALHSPSELRVAAIVGAGSRETWEWLKWLPHTQPRGFPVDTHPLACTPEAAVALLEGLDGYVAERAQADAPPASGRVLVLVDDADLPVDRARFEHLLALGPKAGVHVLWVSAEFRRLPAACGASVLVGHDGRGTLGFGADGRIAADLELEASARDQALATALALAPVVDVSSSTALSEDPPERITLPVALDDVGILDRPERVLARWAEAEAEGGLPVTIGHRGRSSMVVDIRRDGPHALIAGTTGAGKSELLQSLLASLAVTHSPERLTFLLVDYKGGAAFKDCKNLPHTVGFVTDLDQHEVHRSLISLNAELTHRERLLDEYDAKDLMEMEEKGIAAAPPSLMIVIDEFAALAKEVPEFVEGVVNVAQRGRSLGLHLLLATQRPAGVITDNIRANTNLRIALRVSDTEDSVDVIGLPTAAHLSRSLPGRAVAKVGPGEILPFQSAYVGAHTEPGELTSRVEVQAFHLGGTAPFAEVATPEHTVLVPAAGQTGRTLPSTPAAAPSPGGPSVSDVPGGRASAVPPTDLARIVETSNGAFASLAVPPPRKPWLDPLPSLVDLLDEAAFTGGGRSPSAGRVLIGRTDDPSSQAQHDALVDFEQDGSLLIFGASRAGKSALLRTIAVSAGQNEAGEPVQVYGLDFTGRGLGAIEPLPHVGSVIAGDDEERVARLLRHLLDEQRRRSRAFNEAGGASDLTEYRRAVPGSDLARILVLVDGYPAFNQLYESTFDDLPEQMARLVAEGRPVGIHLVLTSDLRAGVPMKVFGSVARKVVLRMATDDEYSNLGLPLGALPTDAAPGRGYLDDQELQVALVGSGTSGEEQVDALRSLATHLHQPEAPPIQRLETELAASSLERSARPGWVVIGRSGASLQPVSMNLIEQHTMVIGPARSGRTSALLHLARGCPDGTWSERILLSPRATFLTAAPDLWTARTESASATAAMVRSLVDRWRPAEDDEADGDGSEAEVEVAAGPTGPVLIVIDDLLEMMGDYEFEESLQSLIALARDLPIRFLAAADLDVARRSGSGPFQDLRSSKHGILLQPESGDGDLLGAQFRISGSAVLPNGRGYLIVRGTPELVQLADPLS